MIWPKENENQTFIGLRTMAKTQTEPRYVLCVENRDCEDLEKRKIYRLLPDKTAAKDGYLRVADESGEDYLYPA